MDNPLFIAAPDPPALRELRSAVVKRQTDARRRRDAKHQRLTRAILWTAIVLLTTATAASELFREALFP